MTASPLITSLQHTVCRGLLEEHPEPSGNAPWHKAAVTEVGWHGDKMSSLGNDSSKEHSGAEPAVSPRSRSPGIGTARFLVTLSVFLGGRCHGTLSGSLENQQHFLKGPGFWEETKSRRKTRSG